MVTVVIIFLNAEKFIQEAIDSVLAQTYHDWELLLVDDGSTDGSSDIAWQYAEQYPERVHYLEHQGHQNYGMSASRNLGVRHAAGEYLAFLDADDTWFPNTLQEQVASLEAHWEAAMVYGRLLYWYSWTGNSNDEGSDYIEELGVPPNQLVKPPALLPLFLCDKAAVPSGFLVRRTVFERFGGFEESFRGEYEDQVFCAKVCLHAPVFASSRCWYRYRQHHESCVHIGHTTGVTNSARLVFLKWLSHYLKDQGVTDPAVWWALRQEFWRYSHPRFFWLLRRGRRFVRHMNGSLKEHL
jgi:glycosyltransferase involved in cell wall biosynthesis